MPLPLCAHVRTCRWAAKEAFTKAVGIRVLFPEVEVVSAAGYRGYRPDAALESYEGRGDAESDYSIASPAPVGPVPPSPRPGSGVVDARSTPNFTGPRLVVYGASAAAVRDRGVQVGSGSSPPPPP